MAQESWYRLGQKLVLNCTDRMYTEYIARTVKLRQRQDVWMKQRYVEPFKETRTKMLPGELQPILFITQTLKQIRTKSREESLKNTYHYEIGV